MMSECSYCGMLKGRHTLWCQALEITRMEVEMAEMVDEIARIKHLAKEAGAYLHIGHQKGAIDRIAEILGADEHLYGKVGEKDEN